MNLMHLQDGIGLPGLKRCREGQLAILESELYKLVSLISRESSNANKEKEYLAGMLSDISHQILTLSQLDADMLKLKREEVSVRGLLNDACQPFEIMAEMKEIELIQTAPGDMKVWCDRHWTREAVSNIIKNCLEHTPSGGRVRILAAQNNFSTTITVEDNGEGIPREQLPHIFERFYKGTGASKDSVGIGLAMSKQIVLRQNGNISVRSEPGKGTCFHIKLYSDVEI